MDAASGNENGVEFEPSLALVRIEVDRPRQDIEEDAPPLFLTAPPLFLAAVFDGLGGAGARKVNGEHGLRSSAYYGARLARHAVERLAVERGDLSIHDEQCCASAFAAAIGGALAERNRDVPVQSGAIRSSMLRSYPTTAAILLFERKEENIDALALWAGDSRCYVLTPAMGLQQLSLDDSSTGSDPMEALRDDGPMSKLLSADAPCTLRSNLQSIAAPVILLVATDGAFGYLQSPMHFELKLLETLEAAVDAPDWERRLGEDLASVASDDISLVAVVIGWPDLPSAARAFAGRLEEMRRNLEGYRAAREAAIQHEEQARSKREKAQTLLVQGWSEYREQYLARAGAPS